MEPAILGVTLDSSIVIEAERQHLNAAQFPKQIAHTIGGREAALSSIAVAELAYGFFGPAPKSGACAAGHSSTI